MNFIEPKQIEIGKKTYIISKFPAVAGREIIAKYPISNIPKLGDYKVSEEIMLKLMSYVQVLRDDGNPIQLDSKDLVNNHVPDWEVLAKLEVAMIEHNCSFFKNGKSLSFLDKLKVLAELKVSEMLTTLSDNLSQVVKQHSKSSKKRTR